MKIQLQPACLRWARERAGLTIAELATKMNLQEDKIISWEETGEITLARAKKLAQKTYIPFGYLFLPEPFDEILPIKDFRTLELQGVKNPSVDLLDTVNNALLLQDWYRDYIISNDGEPLPFVGSLEVSDGILEAAARIRKVIGWDTEQDIRSPSWERALSHFINTVRASGILVLRSGIVGSDTHRPLNVSEFRGFSLADEYAPLIFINGKDAKAAQKFTLAHELVHIWLGESGVTNLRLTYSQDHDIEKFCNAVAAELLVPSKELTKLWRDVKHYSDNVSFAAKHFKVSNLVMLRRLHDTRDLSYKEFQQRYNDELAQSSQRIAQTDESGSRGGNFYNTTRARFGEGFLSALIASTLEGSTPYRETLQLLGIKKTDTLRNLGHELKVIT